MELKWRSPPPGYTSPSVLSDLKIPSSMTSNIVVVNVCLPCLAINNLWPPCHESDRCQIFIHQWYPLHTQWSYSLQTTKESPRAQSNPKVIHLTFLDQRLPFLLFFTRPQSPKIIYPHLFFLSPTPWVEVIHVPEALGSNSLNCVVQNYKIQISKNCNKSVTNYLKSLKT